MAIFFFPVVLFFLGNMRKVVGMWIKKLNPVK